MTETLLAAVDFETSGLDIRVDKPVQIGLVLRLYTGYEYTDFEAINMLCNPGKPIDPGASAVHGISDDLVADQVSAHAAVDYLSKLVSYYSSGRQSYTVGFNSSNYDLPMANNVLQRQAFNLPHIDVLRFARRYFPDVKGHLGGKTLGELHQVFLGRPLEKAHSAVADIVGTLDLLQALQAKAGATLEQMAEDQAVARPYVFMPLGRYIGLPIEDVPRSWAAFMSTRQDLDPDLRATVDAMLAR